MFDFTDEQKMVRQMVRKWVEAKLVPAVDDLESEKILPYDLMRNFIDSFGVAELARAAFKKMEEQERHLEMYLKDWETFRTKDK